MKVNTLIALAFAVASIVSAHAASNPDKRVQKYMDDMTLTCHSRQTLVDLLSSEYSTERGSIADFITGVQKKIVSGQCYLLPMNTFVWIDPDEVLFTGDGKTSVSCISATKNETGKCDWVPSYELKEPEQKQSNSE